VRSYVVQQKVKRIKNLEEPRRELYRPRAIKKMTIELDRPFVYPAEPTDLSPYVYLYVCCLLFGICARVRANV